MGVTVPRSLLHSSPTEGVGMGPGSWSVPVEGLWTVYNPSSG